MKNLLVAITVLLALSGCAVTSGTTFSGVASAVAAGSDDSSEAPGADSGSPDADDEEFSLRVVTDPEGATVYLNGRRQGTTPLQITNLDPGVYTLEIERDGYYGERRRIEIQADRALVIDTELEQITGFLDIVVRPGNAEVFVNGIRFDPGVSELPVGSYRVRARLFGYREGRSDVVVRENSTSRVSLTLEPAPFEVSDLGAWRRAFNPGNPGSTGSTTLSFRVTAPGSGRFTVTNASGRVVREISAGSFDTWDQQVRWDGTDATGAAVPDGTYTIQGTFEGDDGRIQDAVTTVAVDSSLLVGYASQWGASPGLLYAPHLTPLPPGWAQVAFEGTGIITVVDDQIVSRIPLRLGTRFGLGSGLELALYGGYTAHSDPLDGRYQAGGSLSFSQPIVRSPGMTLRAGILGGGMYQTGSPTGEFAGPDTQASFPGLYGSIPIVLETGPLSVVLAPEYRATPAPVVSAGSSLPPNSWGSILYLRSGLSVQLGSVSLGLSTALRTERLGTGFNVDPPVPAGLELHWILPDSPVTISGYLAGEFESLTDFYIMSGGGVGVLF